MNRVVITGMGCITPIGATVDAFRDALFAGRSGIGPLDPAANPGLRFTRIAAVAPEDFDPTHHLTPTQITTTERSSQFALASAQQAIAQSRLTDHHPPHNIAIILGCATGGRSAEEPETARLYRDNARVHPLTVARSMASAGASNVAIAHHITGPTLNISTACSSSTHAIGLAFHMVRSGLVTAAVTGGHEAPLTFGFLRAWDSMRVVSPTSCRPFSADRDGMTLAEGAAILTIESLSSARARSAPIFAEIVGFGMSADAYHITQPKPEGAAQAIHACLADTARTFAETDQPGTPFSIQEDVGYINAHGTGTQANDAIEAAAIALVFGPRATRIPISSTKSLHGHSIGATGAIEVLATLLALHHGRLPHTAGLVSPDPAIKLDFILETPRATGPTIALSNSLAFGGLNAVLALRTYTP